MIVVGITPIKMFMNIVVQSRNSLCNFSMN